VTALVSTSKPRSDRETSLATIRSACFFSRFAVARAPKQDGQRVGAAGSLDDLLRGLLNWTVIGDGSRHHDDIRLISARQHDAVHVLGATHLDDLGSCRLDEAAKTGEAGSIHGA